MRRRGAARRWRSRTACESPAPGPAVHRRLRGVRLPGGAHRGGGAARGRAPHGLDVRPHPAAVRHGVRVQRRRVVARDGRGGGPPPAPISPQIFVPPLVRGGGEPFKIAAVAPWLGLRRAAGSAVIYQMLHTFGMLLSFLTAVVLGIVFLPRSPVIVALLAGAFLALAALTLLLLTGHQRGMLAGALDLLHRVPLLDRLARRLEPKRATLASMDEQITQFYHSSPRRFLQALALEYASRCLFMAEYLLIALSVGLDIG